MVQTLADHALAHVESEDHVDRQLLERGEVDLLHHTVVDDLEIRRPQPADDAAVVGDEDVNAHRLEPAGKRGRLRCHDGSTGNGREQRGNDSNPVAHHGPRSSNATNSSNRAMTERPAATWYDHQGSADSWSGATAIAASAAGAATVRSPARAASSLRASRGDCAPG